MTRENLVAAAARRMGDESAEFKAYLENEYPFVIRDMAAKEALDLIRATKTGVNLTDGQREYDVTTLLGISNEVYDIESVVCWEWGASDGVVVRAQSDAEFIRERLKDGESGEARPEMYRFHPTRATIEFTPIPTSDAANDDLEITYIAEPTIVGSTESEVYVRVEHQEVVVWGLMVRGAHFKEEWLALLPYWDAKYMQGIASMRAKRFNQFPGRIQPQEPYHAEPCLEMGRLLSRPVYPRGVGQRQPAGRVRCSGQCLDQG